MWEVVNETPFEANCGFTRDKNGEEHWIAVVKATYDISEDGTLTPSEEQKDVCHGDEYHGEPALSSIKYPSDIVLNKLKTDVIVNGHAYSKKPTKKTYVNLRFGNKINKKLIVKGHSRYFGFLVYFGSMRDNFTKTPVLWEHSYGGQSEDFKKRYKHNPVGAGYLEKKGELTPSIHPPFRPNKSAGFGATDKHWYPRYKFAGTYNKKWEENQKPFLPLDFDDRFYQVAPKDQQVKVSGSEAIEIKNMTIDGSLKFKLPEDKFSITTYMDGEEIIQEANLHTIIIEPDFPRIIMVWQNSLNCNLKEDLITHAVVNHKGNSNGN